MTHLDHERTDASSQSALVASDTPIADYYSQCSGQRVYTDAVIVQAIKKEHPDLTLSTYPAVPYTSGGGDLLAFAKAGFARLTTLSSRLDDPLVFPLVKRTFIPSARRAGEDDGNFRETVLLSKYKYEWQGNKYLFYLVSGKDDNLMTINYYVLSTRAEKSDELIKAATLYASNLHNEIWVFDGNLWRKDAALYENVMSMEWDAVILPQEMKIALRNDFSNFFDSRDKYKKLKVAWKRGAIFYGPAGNGKTISIKATMHELYTRPDSIPSLYVKSISNYLSIDAIFIKARSMAPCYLVFEDLDSLVTDQFRSYFLNAVDGLASNDGIYMVGSTNYIERLDPGIAKRPSRFDRKFEFSKPNFEGRVRYAEFWRQKLRYNEDIEFPEQLCPKVAEITGDFSFAYIQEAFVASLLAIAAETDKDESADAVLVDGDEFESLRLWVEMKRQVKLLREQM